MPFFRQSPLALLLLTPLAAAQEPSASTEATSGAADALISAPQQPLLEIPAGFSSNTDPAVATALLSEIAEAQFQAQKAQLVGGIFLELYLKERQDGKASEIGFGLQYLVQPREIITLEIDDPDRGTSVQKGFDGRNYWLIEGDKEKQLLSGHEFGKDRESIDEAMDLCSDLMLMLDFRQLKKRNMPRAVLNHENGQRILTGDLKRQEGSKWRYHLWLAPGNLQPYRLELARRVEVELVETATDATVIPVQPATVIEYQRFELQAYEAFKERSIPRLIEVFYAPFVSRDDLPARILQIRRFDWISQER